MLSPDARPVAFSGVLRRPGSKVTRVEIATYLAVRALVDAGKAGIKAADQKVAEAAAEQNITKDEAWAAIGAEARRRGDETVQSFLREVLGPEGLACGRPCVCRSRGAARTPRWGLKRPVSQGRSPSRRQVATKYLRIGTTLHSALALLPHAFARFPPNRIRSSIHPWCRSATSPWRSRAAFLADRRLPEDLHEVDVVGAVAFF